MKKIILALVCCTMMLQQMSAQQLQPADQNGKPHKKKLSIDERVKNQTEKATSTLGLSADQKDKWAAASKERISKNEPLKQQLQGSTTPEQRKSIRQQMQQNNRAFDQSVNAFLTPDQQSKYAAMKAEHKQKHGHGNAGKRHRDDSTPAPANINKN
jgi:ABC-type protease/lipase transport system fused ATPase/permease subunit